MATPPTSLRKLTPSIEAACVVSVRGP